MKKLLFISTIFLISCATTGGLPTPSLTEGMTVQQVDALGGNPWAMKTENETMCRSYVTPVNSLKRYTHVDFKNGKVVGWKSDQILAECRLPKIKK